MYETEKLPITSWAEDDRPREKMMLKGKHSLSDAELLAIILGSGNRKETAVDLAKRILADSGNDLNRIGTMAFAELQQYNGVGEAKAVNVIAALELGRRRSNCQSNEVLQVTRSGDAYQFFRRDMEDLVHEEFWVLLLTRSNKVLRKEQVSKGGMNATVVDPRMVFRSAVALGANSIVICHNHPSGEVKPSENDIRLTRKLKEGALLLDISLIDHIIVGANTYFSFADEGLL
ncbi:MAG: DNA repair protein RadC [Bacteroidetes bacterium]|nr:DNA repair protein RadC [Bacteroidota bacterium]